MSKALTNVFHSNTFIMALAGHETSSHTLAFAIAYLALDPEKQAWLFEELSEVYPPSHVSVSGKHAPSRPC